MTVEELTVTNVLFQKIRQLFTENKKPSKIYIGKRWYIELIKECNDMSGYNGKIEEFMGCKMIITDDESLEVI